MKKSILVSALLLAGAGCAAEQGDLADVQSDAITARANLIDQVFVSKSSFKVTHYKWDEATRTSVPVEAVVKLRFKFIRATSGYTLDGKANKGLDYEVIVEEFIESTGESFPTDMTYYARRKSNELHYFYDCDSTRTCENTNGGGRDSMYIYDLPGGGKGLKLVQKEVVLIDPSSAVGIAPGAELEFVAVGRQH